MSLAEGNAVLRLVITISFFKLFPIPRFFHVAVSSISISISITQQGYWLTKKPQQMLQQLLPELSQQPPDVADKCQATQPAEARYKTNLCKPTLPGGVVQQGWVQRGRPQGNEGTVKWFTDFWRD